MSQQDKAVRDRLRRAEGQLRGVISMLEQGRDCEALVTQLMAVRSAVERAASELVTAHIDECLANLPPEQARAMAGRAVKLLGKLS